MTNIELKQYQSLTYTHFSDRKVCEVGLDSKVSVERAVELFFIIDGEIRNLPNWIGKHAVKKLNNLIKLKKLGDWEHYVTLEVAGWSKSELAKRYPQFANECD